MKQAKASADDLWRVGEFFEMIQEVVEHGTYTADPEDGPEHIVDAQFAELINRMWNEGGPGVGKSWRRVVLGCEVLIENCCDPDADTLELRPDIKAAMEAAGVK